MLIKSLGKFVLSIVLWLVSLTVLFAKWVCTLWCSVCGNKEIKKETQEHAVEVLVASQAAKSWLSNTVLICHYCLQAGTFWVKELGRGAVEGRVFSCLVGTARPLDCLSNCPCRMLCRNLWEGCGAGGVLYKQRQQRFSLHWGHGVV